MAKVGIHIYFFTFILGTNECFQLYETGYDLGLVSMVRVDDLFGISVPDAYSSCMCHLVVIMHSLWPRCTFDILYGVIYYIGSSESSGLFI